MKKIFLPAVMALALFAISCNDEKKTDTEVAVETETKSDTTTPPPAAAGNDESFALPVGDNGILEVKLAQLAQSNGKHAKVKELGKMLETDHSKANEELKAWAAKNNVTLPAAMGPENQQKFDGLSAKKGSDFDKAFTEAMVAHHEASIAKFKTEAESGNNAELKAWAAGKVPVLEHHLEMAKAARDAVK